MQLRFIKLLCVYEPETVCAYLSGNDGYPLEETLDLVGTKHNIMDAHAYLLERTGDKAGALNLILTSLTANAKNLLVSLPLAAQGMWQEGRAYGRPRGVWVYVNCGGW
jgi:hypothetical protein